jgi:release factor glutamine methyltransferase
LNEPVKKSLLKKFLSRVLFPVSNWYLAKERTFRFKEISIKVVPGVFHPGFFFSTKNLLKFLNDESQLLSGLNNKTFLELGAGSGLISIFASKKKAKVIASDISTIAIKNIEENIRINNADVKIIHSDLFEKIPPGKFDYIIINPPYYNKTPVNEKDYAWFCGNDFQYFRKLFIQIPQFINENSKAIMILSEVCEVEKIKTIAFENNIELSELKRIKSLWEWNYIFRVISVTPH